MTGLLKRETHHAGESRMHLDCIHRIDRGSRSCLGEVLLFLLHSACLQRVVVPATTDGANRQASQARSNSLPIPVRWPLARIHGSHGPDATPHHVRRRVAGRENVLRVAVFEPLRWRKLRRTHSTARDPDAARGHASKSSWAEPLAQQTGRRRFRCAVSWDRFRRMAVPFSSGRRRRRDNALRRVVGAEKNRIEAHRESPVWRRIRRLRWVVMALAVRVSQWRKSCCNERRCVGRAVMSTTLQRSESSGGKVPTNRNIRSPSAIRTLASVPSISPDPVPTTSSSRPWMRAARNSVAQTLRRSSYRLDRCVVCAGWRDR